ncbi:endopeptidase La [Alloyangia pacifica]|uniref:Lon protease n=1 Tax=Alloyangia pacifica TaxID=311180 RepID=A0A1I6VGB0_9RHOB|nr:endopeptidase La [Alloyangia pacifica]SDH96728.1 ATP-dependent Lon protease [Alloyangia pacifica]SFT12752.1 ATP-dependent Lon protease [Alloyangia pacifica]
MTVDTTAGVAGFAVPEDALILLPMRDFVGFPGTVFPLAIGQPSSVVAIERALRDELPIGIILQRGPEEDAPDAAGLHPMGCVAEILRYVTTPDDARHLICRGTARFRLLELLPDTPYPVARIERVEDVPDPRPETEAHFLHLRELAVQLLHMLPEAPEGLAESVAQIDDPGYLADLAANYTDMSTAERQDLLETPEISARIEAMTQKLSRRVEVLRITREISEQAREELEGRHREVILREQLAAIRRELGEADTGGGEEVAGLSSAIMAAGMPEATERHVLAELGRYESMAPGSAEAAMLRSWLDTILDLPWRLPEETTTDLAAARRTLDADHYGLEKIKARIIEYLAVRRLAPAGKAPILCFVGPPGVGKTSLGQSIARALNRPFARLSLGGVHDEAEIRGHRRTYVGAMPGMVIQQIRRAGARNCVLMLDEIDKLGQGLGGDPSAALLEVLDPTQNASFHDNYLGTDFDLSHVVFLCTANTLETVPAPLRDRMEIIALAGYLEDEKLEIARRYLLPAQLAATGLTPAQARIDEAALHALIRGYTREAGVRGLEQKIGALLRHVAVSFAEGRTEARTISESDLAGVLGPPRFENEIALRTSLTGVATGLAWTPVGGDILFIEASRVPGKGRLTLTGQLGEVMRESAQAAVTLVKARATGLGIDPQLFETSDIHVHVPAGATPKDGPSAGTAIFAALASLLLDRKLRSDTAMTGEISLRGLVLPVGGIREKVVAAAAAGITQVLLPERNRPDIEDIPEAARRRVTFVWLRTVDDVLIHALEPAADRAEEPAV